MKSRSSRHTADVRLIDMRWLRRRFIPRAIVCLIALGGALVNIAVAWGCALLVDQTKVEIAETSLLGSKSESWRVDRVDRFGITWHSASRWVPEQSSATLVLWLE